MYRYSEGWRCAVKVRAHARDHYARNREAEKERHRRYKAENREKVLRRERELYDPDRARDRNARRVRVLGVYVGTVGFTASEREAMLNGTSQ